MPTAKPLRVEAAFGSSLSTTLLLAGVPGETHLKGKPVPTARTFVLELKGNRCVVREELPIRLVRSGYSTSGTAYCGLVEAGSIYKWHAGKWSEEKITDQPIGFVRYVYVVSGPKPEADTVFVATKTDLYIRQAGVWQKKAVPGDGFPLQMVGTRPDEVFIGGPQLCVWNGVELKELARPRSDTANCVAISADGRLIAGTSYVSASTPDGGWERLDVPLKDFTWFTSFRDEVLALSDEHGVVRVYPGPAALLSKPLAATGIVTVGDGVIAFGDDGVLAYDGQQWFDVQVPVCEVGGQPV